MSKTLIQAEHLSKTYKVFTRPVDRFVEAVTGRPRHQKVEALKDVGFELKEGEGLGIVGENGAGKSTLLKILSGVTVPTEGRLRVEGRVASLLELGMGFHSELTGRQNIRLNAAMMGFTDEETDVKTPRIIDFSELGEFIDRPIKTYSSGMAMRLGFSIAVQVEPDILIIDEALSVGDGYFQKKCMDEIRRLLDRGCTFLFCSHAMYYVSHFCDQALWLRKGQAEAFGEVAGVVREYESFLAKKSKKNRPQESLPEKEGPASFTAARMLGGQDGVYRRGESLGIEVSWQAEKPDLSFHLGVAIDRSDGVQIMSFSSHRDGRDPLTGSNQHHLRLWIRDLPLLRGEFEIYLFLL
ncbi:uncharacterized protein LOC110245946, partial [Exaiptasia diaphana]|uniref:ABC transporter domain-containing protein n=1 Tax=Exaiptasia diaphana TaxID=2652724 RepID=A0A913XP12_EXADI